MTTPKYVLVSGQLLLSVPANRRNKFEVSTLPSLGSKFYVGVANVVKALD